MDLKYLITFLHVAESGSFTKAGEQLGYSQPTISIHIKQLEEELEDRLFDRIGHTVRLTDRGQRVFQYAQRICRMCQEMSSDSHHPEALSGVVRLATADSMCSPLLSRGFAQFRRRYPNISLQVTTAGTDELFRMLDHNEVDIVCTLDSHIYNTNYIIATEEQVDVHFVLSAADPLAQQEDVTLDELLQRPFLLTERGMSYRRLLDEILARIGRDIHPVLELGQASILCDLVEDGMGAAFLPDYVTDDAVRRGTIRRLEIPGCQTAIWKQLLYHRSKWLSPQLEAAIGHFTAVLHRDCDGDSVDTP